MQEKELKGEGRRDAWFKKNKASKGCFEGLEREWQAEVPGESHHGGVAPGRRALSRPSARVIQRHGTRKAVEGAGGSEGKDSRGGGQDSHPPLSARSSLREILAALTSWWLLGWEILKVCQETTQSRRFLWEKGRHICRRRLPGYRLP